MVDTKETGKGESSDGPAMTSRKPWRADSGAGSSAPTPQVTNYTYSHVSLDFDLDDARVERLRSAGVYSLRELACVLSALDLRVRFELKVARPEAGQQVTR